MRSSGTKSRSIAVSGHKTSVSLETEFWESLGEIALQRGKTRTQLITEIDADRKSSNLSSAIRMYISRYYRDQVEKQKDEIASPTPDHSVQDTAH